MDDYFLLICLVTAISYCSSAPESLDTLTINLNLDGSDGPTSPTPTPPTDYNCTCGIKNPKIVQPTARIVGGENTGIFEYPWMVSIKIKLADYIHVCGGVLIASQWVLTAAHCIHHLTFPPEKHLLVVLGEHDITITDETDKTIIFKPRKIIKHPLYIIKNHANFDIALIKLDGYADLNIYTPACLSEANQFFSGKEGTVTGWGWITPHISKPRQLQVIRGWIGSDEYCQKHDPQGPDYFTETITCLSQLGKIGIGECFGDSGGPLTVPYYGRHYVAGLVHGPAHNGRYCGDGTISIHTSVAKLRNWIDQTIEENGGAAYCTPTPFPFGRDEK